MGTVNPAMVALARESRGWTQTDLATAIRAAQGTISKYELGTPVPDHHLDAISRALNYDRALFEQPNLLVGLGGDFLYRKKASLSAKAQRRIEAEANIRRIQVSRLMRSGAVEERFPFPTIPLMEVDGRPENAAKEARQALRLPSGPIRNVTRVLENAGAIIFTVDFGTDSIDGTNIRLPGLPPLLFLNEKVSGERHRFNLAHEFGHAVMHFSIAIGDPEEEANQFAQEFLMPKAEIRSDLRNLDLTAALRLKLFWGVSMAAIIRRARDLGQITESTYRRLFTQLGAAGLRKREPYPLPFEKPEAFDNLLNFHRTTLGFVEGDMRSLLLTDKLGEISVPRVPQMRLVDGGLFDSEESALG